MLYGYKWYRFHENTMVRGDKEARLEYCCKVESLILYEIIAKWITRPYFFFFIFEDVELIWERKMLTNSGLISWKIKTQFQTFSSDRESIVKTIS